MSSKNRPEKISQSDKKPKQMKWWRLEQGHWNERESGSHFNEDCGAAPDWPGNLCGCVRHNPTKFHYGENPPHPSQSHYDKKPPTTRILSGIGCSVCGSRKIWIRGKYPNDNRRLICPTCVYERLEIINNISSPDYCNAYSTKK